MLKIFNVCMYVIIASRKIWHVFSLLLHSLSLSLSPLRSSLDLHKEFTEEAHSVALHPSGLFVLVGFSEKLRLMSLLINDLRPYKEFPIRGCREVCVHNTNTTSSLWVVIF